MHLETRVLVTGDAGILGSHLCEHLLKQGVNVICADNNFTDTRRNIDDLLEWTPQTALRDGPVRINAYFEKLLNDDDIRPFINHEQGAGA